MPRRSTRPAHRGHFDASDMDPEEVPIVPVTPEDEAWFQARLELTRSLAADDDDGPPSSAPPDAGILFLDLDDVVCLACPFGGCDALDAVTAKRLDPERVYERLLHPPAVQVLTQLHTEMQGRIRYVISSTWRQFLTRSQLRHVLAQAGLSTVANCMENRTRWATPVLPEHDRHQEIGAWLALHHRGEPYAIVDDLWSGSSLEGSLAPPWRIVLCEEDVGLQPRHLSVLAHALRTPKGEHEYW